MTRLRRVMTALVGIALGGALGCGPPPELATLALGLSAVPSQVTTVTVVVRQNEDVVASATVSADVRSVELGVPAEVPLEIVVLGRTDRPGPLGIGRMPAFAGRLVRSIPLAADITRVAVTLRPAGVLTVVVPPSSDAPRTPVVFAPLDGDQRGPRLRLRDGGFTQSYVAPAGHYQARFDLEPTDEGPGFAIDAAGAVFVAREEESVYVLTTTPKPELGEDELVSLSIEPSPSPLRVGELRTLRVVPASVASAGGRDPEARVSWRIDSAPTPAVLTTPDGRAMGTLTGLPAELDVVARAPGRPWVQAHAELEDGRVLHASEALEVIDGPPGPPVQLVARLDDSDARRTGAELLLELLDAQGRYARTSTATLDLSASDPWVDLGGPPLLLVSARLDRGRTIRRISLPSSPRDRTVAIRITASSTTTGFTATATLTLPALDLP